MSNLQVILTKKPGPTYPEVNDVFECKAVDLPEQNQLKEDEILVQTLYLSIDAAMRVWITGVKTYFDPVLPGMIMPALGVGRVVSSRNEKLKQGDIVSGLLQWKKYLIVNGKFVKKVATGNRSEIELLSFLGPLGISGLTAFTGFHNIGKPQPGEIVVVSAAAGAVGELAIQLAKHHYKCKVIGIAGGEDKCKYVVQTLGADACINYKQEDVEKSLKTLCPEGFDVYFDNVGGDQLDAALMNIRDNSRIILCGAISQYNKTRNDLYRVVNYPRLIIKRGLMQGYIYTDYAKSFPEGLKIMNQLMQEGKFKVRYDIQEGLEQASVGLQRLLLGKNEGKVVVRVAASELAPKL